MNVKHLNFLTRLTCLTVFKQNKTTVDF